MVMWVGCFGVRSGMAPDMFDPGSFFGKDQMDSSPPCFPIGFSVGTSRKAAVRTSTRNQQCLCIAVTCPWLDHVVAHKSRRVCQGGFGAFGNHPTVSIDVEGQNMRTP